MSTAAALKRRLKRRTLGPRSGGPPRSRNWPHCQRLGTRMPSTSSSTATKTGSTRSHTGWFGTSRMRSTVSRKRWSRAWKAIGRFRTEARVSTWLHQIVLRKAYDCCRDRKRRLRHCQLPRKGGPSSRPSPIRQMNGFDLVDALHALDADFRVVVVACDVFGIRPFTKPQTHLASPKAPSNLVVRAALPGSPRACPPNRYD